MAAATLMAIAVFLSGSRAGILAMAITMAAWFLANSKFKTQNSKLILAVAVIALPLILYFFKKDSANGRLLIWRTTLDMVADKPIVGHGAGAFQAKYMLYQADYFNAHPDSRYVTLADNVLHPFNEYLLVLCEHGIVGLGIIALLVFFLVRAYRRNPGEEKFPALMSLLALAVFSFFSYPFRYPFTWMMLSLCMAVIFKRRKIFTTRDTKDFHKEHKGFISRICALCGCFVPFVVKKQPMTRPVVFLLSAGLLIYATMLTQAEIKSNGTG